MEISRSLESDKKRPRLARASIHWQLSVCFPAQTCFPAASPEASVLSFNLFRQSFRRTAQAVPTQSASTLQPCALPSYYTALIHLSTGAHIPTIKLHKRCCVFFYSQPPAWNSAPGPRLDFLSQPCLVRSSASFCISCALKCLQNMGCVRQI